MRKYADKVREAGMGFGLWMEPERAAKEAGIVKQKPEWFLKTDRIIYDLTKIIGINDESGWAVLQYENIDGKGSVIYAYRLQSHEETLLCYPKNIDCALQYNVTFCSGDSRLRSGADILSNGIETGCTGDYHSQVLAVCPAVI